MSRKFPIGRVIADITDFIFVADPPRKADAIFIPGGSDPAPPELAAKLYADGFATLIFPSGGVSVKTGKFGGVKRGAERYDGDYKTDCGFMTDVLIKNGVPSGAIIGEDKSGYTKENAVFTRKAADENGLTIKTAIVCSKAFHARRCLMCYQFAFPETEIIVAPAEAFGINRDNWFTFEYGVERVMGELARCGNQFAEEVAASSAFALAACAAETPTATQTAAPTVAAETERTNTPSPEPTVEPTPEPVAQDSNLPNGVKSFEEYCEYYRYVSDSTMTIDGNVFKVYGKSGSDGAIYAWSWYLMGECGFEPVEIPGKTYMFGGVIGVVGEFDEWLYYMPLTRTDADAAYTVEIYFAAHPDSDMGGASTARLFT